MISEIPAGTLLYKRYKIIKSLGKGGFGHTYQAQDKGALGQSCVVKHLQPVYTDPASIQIAKRFFDDEAKILQELSNKSLQIPRLLAHFEEKGQFYLVQEFIDGHDLNKEIVPGKKFSDTEVITLLKSILEVLVIAHEHQPEAVIHRDIKPANIMRCRDGKIVLIDFGAVKKISQQVMQATGGGAYTLGIGTPGYMPYEQSKGMPKLSSDIYAVGMIGIQALTGRFPHDLADDPATREILWKYLVPNIDPALAAVLEKMVLHNFRDRYQNAREALAALSALSPASSRGNLQPPNPPRPTIPVGGIHRIGTWISQSNINRRQWLKWAGFGGAGAALAFLIPNLVGKQSSPSPSASSSPSLIPNESPLPSPSPTPITPSSPSPQPLSSPTPNNLAKWDFETAQADAQGTIISRPKKNAEYFVDDLGNGINLFMIKIPGDSFMMGSPATEAERDNDEGEQRTVNVPSFFMSNFVVTQEQYQAVMGINPSNFKGVKHPVEQVSWNDAMSFCQQLFQKTGKKYRLPSEAEWEYACRAGTTTPFYFGATITPDLVNYDGNYPYGSAPKNGLYRQQTTDVGSFPPNAFGLYDMHGNVLEWCSDIYQENYNGAPKDGSSWETPTKENYRVLRGGSWYYVAFDCRSANRFRYRADDRINDIGFRLVVAFA